MSSEMRECPFCGGEAERIDFGPGSGDNEGGSCVACTRCQASGPVEFGYKENFISNWNRRALLARTEAGADEWPFVEEIGRDGKPTGYWIRKGTPAAARNTHPQDASGDAAMREALENSNSLLVALLIEPRDRTEIEQQIADNRAAMQAKEAK